MQDFEYAAPTSVEAAVRLLSERQPKVKVLAGGTDILVQLRERLREADFVVDIKKIDELLRLGFRDGGLELGAAVPCYRIYENKELAAAFPALADSARIIGGWQIQSRASLGGNLCNASPAADGIPSLLVHQARCVLAGPDGRRTVPVADFCTAPGKNCLKPAELLVALHFDRPATHSASAYQRFIPRNEMDIAVVGAAAWVQLDPSGATIVQGRVALGAVAPTPVLATAASDFLSGQPATDATFARAGELARQSARPISDMRGTAEYRTHLVGVLVKRTLADAVARAKK